MSIKSSMLKALEKNKGSYISGQDLARMLSVSRTSVWKAVKALQSEGYPIEAVTNRGYMLSEKSPILSPEAIEEHLDPSADINSITILKSTDSTNNEAKRILMEDEGSRAIVFAEEQTAGKGRLGRSFSSPKGDSIYVSFILEPSLDVNDSLLITVAASVAVARAIDRMGEINGVSYEPQIKWVNDVYLDGKKICGILTEAVSDVESGQIHSLVLGIGVNINIDTNDYPDELRDQIGTLEMDPGQRNQFAAILVSEVLNIQKEIHEKSFMDEYRRMSLILNKDIFVIREGEKIEATAVDITDRGSLMVKYKTGETEILSTGEVSIRLNN